MAAHTADDQATPSAPDLDVVVVGAGFAGLYLLHRLRKMGLSARVIDAADGVGGTWYWNRYPGARCDIQSIDYSYSFDAELEAQWEWSEKYATQPEILRYLNHVADRHDLRRDIQLSTRVEGARWDEESSTWRIRTDPASAVSCRYFVMATGCLSMPKTIDIDGADRFRGATYSTSSWPHDGVDFTGMRVGVIGTGSSGIQSIPLIAEQASELTVFQRTPNFSIPARNGAMPALRRADYERDRAAYREEARLSRAGVPIEEPVVSALAVSESERKTRFEDVYALGELIAMMGTYNDTGINLEANDLLADFVRDKIRARVDDPATAELLCPDDHPFGTKRLCLDTDYYETYNLDHVRLVDLRAAPIATITETGIATTDESYDLDAIVYATGFDAMTGAIVAVDITGRDGVALRDKWADGPHTYLGLMTAGFPNLFMITGPGSPSVLSNMAVSIEQHVDWICDCLEHLRAERLDAIEPTETAEEAWVRHGNEYADLTLAPMADSWYMGANVPGKPRVFLPYIGGVGPYRTICDEVAAGDYIGFALDGPAGPRRNEDIIRPLKPDVALVLEAMEALGLPPIESLPVDDARAFMAAVGAQGPPGPDVGEVLDGVLPGAEGDLAYRLYRPDSAGPHPIVAYFHGGGWVLGDLDADDAFCRDLCVQSDAVIVSVDYRHAPEARFPAAPEDGFAAVQWIAANATALGGVPGQLAVAGWSAGANVAAVVCQTARGEGGPAIVGQLLVNPVTDCDLTRPSYVENGDGYVLTAALMAWFWDHYADPADRDDPRASPLRAESLADLPPAVVVTAEFDPLRDEGIAYVDALEGAGVDVRHLRARGQIHTSMTAVGIVVTGAETRSEMGRALAQVFGAAAPA